jgi:hypothetical protein
MLVLLLLTAVSTRLLSENTRENRRLASLGVAPLGSEVFTDSMSLRVESVREDSVGALPFVPRDGFTFIIPTVTITNLSSTTRDLIPTLALYIKDRDGNVYNMAVAPLNTEQFGGPIPPHDKVRQEMAFEVRKDAKGLVMYFEAGGKVMTERLEK